MRLLFSFLAVLVLPLHAQQAGKTRPTIKLTTAEVATKEIVYKTTPQGELKLHVFSPKGEVQAAVQRPCVVFFFGGGWKSGSYLQFVPHSEYLASRGIVAISAIASSAPDTSIVTAGIDPQSTLPTMAANAITNNLLQYRGFCAANLTPIAVKSSAGKIHGIYCINNVASARYLKLYNLAVGSVTVGTTAPFKTFLLPASGPTFINLDDLGIYFGTAITMAISTTFADTGDVAPAAADVLTQIDYI